MGEWLLIWSIVQAGFFAPTKMPQEPIRFGEEAECVQAMAAIRGSFRYAWEFRGACVKTSAPLPPAKEGG